MSAIAVDTMVETPLDLLPFIWSLMTPARPISPGSAESMVELHQDNPVAILNIAKGLTATIQKREQQNALAAMAFDNKISDLE
jgi:hypothetical protein